MADEGRTLSSQYYRFKIDVFSIDTLPMSRLAEYMAELAKLYGEPERVHFVRLEESSAVLVSQIEEPAVPKVDSRLRAVALGEGPADALKAFRALDTFLAKDNAIGTLAGVNDAEIIRFPGRERPKPIRYGPFRERGSLDGVLFRMGGLDETIPVLLVDGDIKRNCNASIEMSIRLAPYYRKNTLRVYGSGRWVREEDGSWSLLRFDIEDFEILDDSPLTTVVERLRAVEGGHWGEGEDAISDLLKLRKDGELQN